MDLFDEIGESIRRRLELAFTQYEQSTKWKEYHVNEFIINHCITCVMLDNKIYSANNDQ